MQTRKLLQTSLLVAGLAYVGSTDCRAVTIKNDTTGNWAVVEVMMAFRENRKGPIKERIDQRLNPILPGQEKDVPFDHGRFFGKLYQSAIVKPLNNLSTGPRHLTILIVQLMLKYTKGKKTIEHAVQCEPSLVIASREWGYVPAQRKNAFHFSEEVTFTQLNAMSFSIQKLSGKGTSSKFKCETIKEYHSIDKE